MRLGSLRALCSSRADRLAPHRLLQSKSADPARRSWRPQNTSTNGQHLLGSQLHLTKVIVCNTRHPNGLQTRFQFGVDGCRGMNQAAFMLSFCPSS